jgi:hypothetical protein
MHDGIERGNEAQRGFLDEIRYLDTEWKLDGMSKRKRKIRV